MEPHKLLALYHTMVMARAVERRLWTLNASLLIRVGGFEAVQVARDCMSVVETAIEQARSAPSPQPASALDNVYA